MYYLIASTVITILKKAAVAAIIEAVTTIVRSEQENQVGIIIIRARNLGKFLLSQAVKMIYLFNSFSFFR